MSVKFKIVSAFALLISTIVLVITLYSDHNFKQSSTHKALSSLELEAKLVSSSVQNKMLSYYQGLRLISETLAIDETGMPITAQLANQLIKVEKNLGMFGAAYATDDGITYKPEGIIPNFNAKRLQREWFVRSMANQKNVATLPYVNNLGELVMSLSVPVKRLGKIVGVLNANISVDEISRSIKNESQNNQVYLSRADGYVLASGDPTQVGINLFEIHPSFQQYITDNSSSHTYMKNNIEHYVVSANAPELGWHVWSWETWQAINADAENNLLKSTYLAVVLTIFALLATYFLVVKLMYVPIGGEPSEIEEMVKQIANGNLAIDLNESIELSGIHASLQSMTKRLIGSVDDINKATHELINTANRSMDSASGLTTSSNSQMLQIEQTSAAMHEMSLTVDEVANNAVQASVSADQANQFSQNGMDLVQDMNKDINHLLSGIEKVANVTSELETETQSIGGILDVIYGISEQTNLLALNAAIEAARAGEHGRGFAVVADEVRNLANRTKESTNTIQDMISRLQEKAQNSVQLMSVNVKDTEVTVARSQEAKDALIEIQNSVAVIKDMNNQIATAVEQQSHVANEINTSIVAVNDLARVNNKRSTDNKALADDLKNITSRINESVAFFQY
ncbi:methyl-accepting chemotaxis protein [Vibrio algarum]|uniref:Methyl-accepting chemotaxis protein n=1 Tax=Vibrio algarum TaxID=3020714 RepID=A0ABT4YVA4_9VIBR|nr:methyl-accepting chemotaxis protein [Vibrio sp. KJ40-1]MDB1125510.1 methyl-accepting chemotaxis protein [Vibrio sp. KJ40-1]